MEDLPMKELLELNAKLQQKKNAVRKALAEKGVLKKAGKNDFDHYTYFSEAQYKELFTELFSHNGLELKFDEVEYAMFEGVGKQPNGRKVKLVFSLIDIDTGFSEKTTITGEGLDKGDKAGYKAYTGAVKYFLANTFMVATGDDPENESPDVKANVRRTYEKREQEAMAGRTASKKQIEILETHYQGELLEKLLAHYQIKQLADIPMVEASMLIKKIIEKGDNKHE